MCVCLVSFLNPFFGGGPSFLIIIFILLDLGRLAKGAVNQEARELLRDLARTRAALVEKLNVASSVPESVVTALEEYLALAVGLAQARGADNTHEVASADDVGAAGGAAGAAGADGGAAPGTGAGTPIPGTGDYTQRLRTATMFKWRDSLTKEVREHEDIQADIVSMITNVGLWHCMHASTLGGAVTAGKDEDVSKKVYHALRAAASFFNCIERDQLRDMAHEPNSDFDERLIKCMAEQCLAEAQEVTAERARTKAYKPPVIAGIAHDQFDRFNRALTLLKTMDEKKVQVLQAYLTFKAHFYSAYALCYTGVQLFSEEKCGQAINVLRRAKADLDTCREKAEGFRSAAAKSGTKLDSITEMESFQELSKEIGKSLTKAEHENGFIYHHKIPVEDEPMLPATALVKVDVWQAPTMSSQWSAAQFNRKKIPVRGTDMAADKASSDTEKVKGGANYLTAKHDECSIL